MKMSDRIIALSAILICPGFVVGQKVTACRVDYADQNQLDYEGRSRVGVRGTVTDPSTSPVTGACVAVFTEKEHRFVVGVKTARDGRFQIPLLRDGDYRLVVVMEGFGIANMKFRKIPEDVADPDLHVHMRVRAIDSTSYID